MKFYWIFLVLVSSQSLPVLEALKLVDNGYENLYVVIQENIHESEELLDRIQDIFAEASTMLFIATHRRAYFKTLKVVIPKSWTKKDYYKTVAGLNSLTSHVRIGDSQNMIPPHTVGSGACGQTGFYVYLPLNEFVMQDVTTSWGPHEKVIVHEWGHLRWGLRDEYPTIKKPVDGESHNAENSGGDSGDNVLNPGDTGDYNSIDPGDGGNGLAKGSEAIIKFTQTDGEWVPVGCPRGLNGFASVDCTSGKPEDECDLGDVTKMLHSKCQFCVSDSQQYNASIMNLQYLQTIEEFCEKDDPNTPAYKRHNSIVDNEQNKYCDRNSSWEVMLQHEDFKDGNNPPMSENYPPAVNIEFVQVIRTRVFVLDSSDSMDTGNRITKLYNMMQYIIKDNLPDESWISVVNFNTAANLSTNFIQLNSASVRDSVARGIPSTTSGITCIGCGLELAVHTLRSFQILDSIEEAEIILISDGQNNRGNLTTATQLCIDTGVVVTSVAFTDTAEQTLENISEQTGGRVLQLADNGTVTLTSIFTEIVSGGIVVDSESSATMMNEQILATAFEPVNVTFSIDDGIGKDTTVTIITTVTSNISILLNGPNNLEITKSGSYVQTLTLVAPGNSQPGRYTAQVMSSTSSNIEIIVTSKPTSLGAEVIRPVVRLSSNAYDYKASVLPDIFVHLRKGESPVKKAIVKVQMEDAKGNRTCELTLLDDGKGVDIQSGDGIYTATILRECTRNDGRHSSKVMITGTSETVVGLYFSSKSAIIGAGVTPTTDSPTGTFERVAVGDAYTVSNYDPTSANEDITPPNRITDIQVIDIHSGLPSTSTTRNYTITWTAPGDDANVGQASFYEMRIADDPSVLQLDFLSADEVNTGGSRMTPNVSGKVERLVMTVSSDDSFTTTTNFAIVAVDEVGNRGPVSNIVPITVGSTSQFEVIEEECTDDCYAVLKDCERDLSVRNGRVNLTNVLTTAGTEVPIMCNVGYELTGGTTLLCQENGTWSNTVTCEIIGCGGISIRNGGLEFPEGTNYNATAIVTCSDGYHITGTSAVTCMADGNWETPGICEKNDCGKNATIAHGQIDFTNADTTYGQSVPVTCDSGYKLFGGHTIQCLADGQWSKTVRCDIKDCESAKIANGVADHQDGTSFGTVANITCDPGYHLVGTGTITCLETELWSSETKCDINDCGANEVIAHGHIDFTNADTTYGQTVPVTCDSGYAIIGGHTIQCLADGQWSKTVSCVIKDCKPTSLPNGVAGYHDGTTYGSVANITCDPGYHLVGIGTITCLETGIWSTETKCVIKDCGASFTIQNGFVNFTNVLTTFGETLPIECDTGYTHKDGSTIRCEAEGNWKTVASCELVDCARASISGGEVTHPSGTKYPARAVVNCDTGYEMVGTGFLECLETELWSTESQCVIRDCGRSVTIANGTVDFTNASTTFGQFVPVNCNIGFRRIGGTSVQCLADGSWSKSVSCQIVGCGWASIANGEIQFPFGTDYNDVAFVNCDAGFHLTMENNEIVCLPNGSWNISVLCEINDCGMNVTIQNGHANFVGLPTTYRQYIPVFCDKGYMRQGGTHIQCLSDGIWSSTVTCDIVDCEHSDIANGVIDFFEGTKYNAKAKLICDFGFRVTGTGFIKCIENGRWSNDSYCSIVDCGRVATVANGSVDFSNASTTYGQSVPVSCNIGFRWIGGTSIECLADGTWSKSVSCELVGCGGASIANGEIRFPNGTDYNAEAFVDCSTGFHLTQESNRIVCLHSGKWNIPLRCEINDCGSTLIIPGGRADFADGLPTTYGEYVSVTCHQGHRRQGGTHIQCLASGEWSSTVTCEIVDCGYLGISNGALDFSNGTKYNSKATLNCDEGYRLYGTGFIECFETGRWSNHSICVIIDCGRDVTIAHGNVNFIDAATTFGNLVPVVCKNGYEINGRARIECLANGMWSSLPTCQITECDTDVEIKNGRANFTHSQTTFGESIPVVCDTGFQLKGNETITCLANRTWSELPVCEQIDKGQSTGLKVVTIVAGSFGFIVLIIIGLLTRSFVINARTRAPGRKSKVTHNQRKYMANGTIVEPPRDYDMESVDWYLYDNKNFQHFDQHYTDIIYY